MLFRSAPITNLGFGPRDLSKTTPQQLPGLGFCHPEMQEVVLTAAESAGAKARRGTTVLNVEPGTRPTVTFQDSGTTKSAGAKLVVAADGRNSAARKWMGFDLHEKPQPFYFAGLLMQGVSIPEDHSYLLFLPPLGQATAMTPTGRGRFRTYVAYQDHEGLRLQGDENVKSFILEATKADLVANCFKDAEAIGPLASFRCGDFWVEHPFRDGVALLGDAASTSDPAFGQGLSTTLRDVRVLRDCLLADEDWTAAGHGGNYYPEDTMSINFNLWFIRDGMVSANEPREYQEDIDWVFHQVGVSLTPEEVETAVARMRRGSIKFRDTVPPKAPALLSPCDF